VDEARALQVRYEQLPEVSRVVSAAMLIPSDQDRKLPLVRAIHERLTGLPDLQAAPNPVPCLASDLRKEIGFLMGALEPQAPVSPQPILEQLLRCLAQLRDQLTTGGDMQARLRPRNEEEADRAREMGLTDLDRLYEIEEMASGSVMFAGTGVTNGDYLDGVRFFRGGGATNSVVMRSRTHTVRFLRSVHRFDLKPDYN
jgi:hypothetical protein